MSIPAVALSSEAKVYRTHLSTQEHSDLKGLLSSVANNSKFWLAFNGKKLTAYKDRLDHVHPLTFLKAAFTDPQLNVHLEGVKKHGKLVMGPLVQGIQEGLEKENKLGNLHQFVPDFSAALSLDEGDVRSAVSSGSLGTFLFDRFC